MLVCSTPVLVPAVGAFLLNFLTVAANILVAVAVAAAVIGALWLVIEGLAKAAEERREREEAHRRWYNSLSAQEKQTYQLERQTRLMEERQRRERYEQAAEAFRRGYQRGSRPPHR